MKHLERLRKMAKLAGGAIMLITGQYLGCANDGKEFCLAELVGFLLQKLSSSGLEKRQFQLTKKAK